MHLSPATVVSRIGLESCGQMGHVKTSNEEESGEAEELPGKRDSSTGKWTASKTPLDNCLPGYAGNECV